MRTYTVTVGATQRQYMLFVPAGRLHTPLPLIIVFHGGHSTPQEIANVSRMHERGQFVVAYPAAAGTDHRWNDGSGEGDDVAFVGAMVQDIYRHVPIDPKRIFACGASNGGMFVLRLACERAEEFAGFGVVCANLPETPVYSLTPSRTVPIVFFHGTEDLLMPFRGGMAAGDTGEVISAPLTVQWFAALTTPGRTPEAYAVDLPDIVPDDGTTVRRIDYDSGATPVRQFIVDGGGHTWPGTMDPSRLSNAGRVGMDIEATDEMLRFWGLA